jgi:small subunit ribosomal protein S8
MLTRIRNAQRAKLSEVSILLSKEKKSLAKILEEEGYVKSIKEKNKFPKELILGLKYDSKKRPVIQQIKKISKPGQRIYLGKNDLPQVLNGLGIAIISTSKGLMTDKQARKNNLGGEVVCSVW